MLSFLYDAPLLLKIKTIFLQPPAAALQHQLLVWTEPILLAAFNPCVFRQMCSPRQIYTSDFCFLKLPPFMLLVTHQRRLRGEGPERADGLMVNVPINPCWIFQSCCNVIRPQTWGCQIFLVDRENWCVGTDAEGFVQVICLAQKKEGANLINFELYVNIKLVSTVVIIRLIKR